MLRAAGLTRNLALLTAAMAVWGLGFGLYGVLWPLYVEHLGGGPGAIGLLQAVAGLTTAAVALPGGRWADRVPAKRLLLWGWLAAVPAPFLFRWAPTWSWLLPGVLLYFGSAFSTPALQSYIRQEAGPRLAVAYNVVMSAFTLGAVLGPALGGVLLGTVGFGPIFLLAGGCYALSTLLLLPIRGRDAPSSGRASGSGSREAVSSTLRGLGPWLLLAMVLAASGGLALPYLVPFWRQVGGLTVRQIGLLGSLGTLMATLMHPVWGRRAERRGLAATVAQGLFLGAAGMAAVLLWPRTDDVQALAALARGAGAATMGLVGVAVGRGASPGRVGSAYGWFNALTELAGAAAPYPGSLLYRWRAGAPMLVVGLTWAFVAVLLVTREPRRPAVRAAPGMG